eukprot:Phypoly_transcript_07561.p1 GENE.Phypoly_transcript_07561~~Phypoly_transcript_07561.p1  ORF type:complete len:360 (+),score=62.10 Phypoly_transcript_07561:303-1382(+)
MVLNSSEEEEYSERDKISEEEKFLAPIPTPEEVARHITLLISKLDNENLAEKFEMVGHLRAIERDAVSAATEAIPRLVSLVGDNPDAYDHVIVLLTLFCVSNERDLAEHCALANILHYATRHDSPESLRLTGRYLDRQAECKIYPLRIAEIYETLVACVLERISIPSDSALRCLAWIADNPNFHNFMIQNNTIDFLLDRLFEKTESPESEYYFSALLGVAKRSNEAREQCGEQGVNLALHGMQNGSETAAKFLAELMDFPPNRERLRAVNGVELVFSFTKNTRLFEGVQILSKLAPSDMLIYGRMFVEMSDLLEELYKDGSESQKSTISECIIAMTTIWEGLRNAQSLKERLLDSNFKK